jgi:protein SCO1/2
MSGRLVRLFLSVLLFSVPVLFQAQGTAGTASMENEDAHYICPMHPEVKSKIPGTCHKCGMTLTVDSHTHASAPTNPSHWGPEYFPNVPLTTQDGVTVHFYDDLLKGKIVAIDLIYTQCKANCPLETARLAQVQRLLGDRVGRDIYFYSISIDPKHDTPELLKAYSERFHVQPGWTFLTGKQEDIDLISRKLGLSSLADVEDADGHTPTLLIGNTDAGQWMKDSALDNPRFLSMTIGQFLDSWKRRTAAAEVVKSYSEAPPIVYDKPAYLFRTRCSACHTIGHGDAVGPDLMGVTTVRDRAWLARFIATPDQMMSEKDAIAMTLFEKYKPIRMPNLDLGADDVADLIAYLEKQATSQSKGNTGKEAAVNTKH